MAKWENKAATHKLRSGNRQVYMGNFKPAHQLERPAFAGSLISIDDRNPPFKDLTGKRVWFYNGIDLASECFTVFVYGKTKEGIIIEFYRQMLRNYTEWGLNIPYELEAESSLNSSFTNTFLQKLFCVIIYYNFFLTKIINYFFCNYCSIIFINYIM